MNTDPAADLHRRLMTTLASPARDRRAEEPLMSALLASGDFAGATMLLRSYEGHGARDQLVRRVHGSLRAGEASRRAAAERNQQAQRRVLLAGARGRLEARERERLATTTLVVW